MTVRGGGRMYVCVFFFCGEDLNKLRGAYVRVLKDTSLSLLYIFRFSLSTRPSLHISTHFYTFLAVESYVAQLHELYLDSRKPTFVE